MRLTSLAETASLLCLTTTVLGQAASSPGSTMNRLIQAAYFSDACRSEAAALDIPATVDADALFAAFARQIAAPRSGRPDAPDNDCKAPLVLLINLLRSNGIDAALAFISMRRTDAAGKIEPAGKIDRVIVYAPALDRYFDPSLGPAKQNVIDAIVRENAARMLIYGPSLAGGRHARPDTRMEVISARRADAVRVETERLRQ
jgi:hypothetical protein